MVKPGLKLGLKTNQRMVLMGRMRMAEWIEMPEREFAREIEKIEKDPLFKKLHFGTIQMPGVIRRQRWPRSRFSNSFYEVNEQVIAGKDRVQVEEKLAGKEDVLPMIKAMGREAFERYFLYGEEALPLEDIAKRTKLSVADVGKINDLLLEIGTQAEVAGPQGSGLVGGGAYACIARLSVEGGEPGFEFFSPHWARGLYQIRYDLLENWKSGGNLKGEELKRLPHLLKRMETVNLRQSTMFRVLESLTALQTEFLRTRRDDLKRPISLRHLARRLDLAPSTISRAVGGNSVRLPWGRELPLIQLLPGRRRVLRDILPQWLAENSRMTDAQFAERLKKEYGISVSRRTVNAVRHEVLKK